MITSIGVLLLSFAIVFKLCASNTPSNLVKQSILISGGLGIGMLLATVVILSLRYLP